MNFLVGHVAGQLPDPTPARPKAAAYGLHAHRLTGLEQNLRRPPMLLSRHALDSLRRPRPVQQCREQKFLAGSAPARQPPHWLAQAAHSQCGLEHIAERPAIRFSASMSVSGKMPRTAAEARRCSPGTLTTTQVFGQIHLARGSCVHAREHTKSPCRGLHLRRGFLVSQSNVEVGVCVAHRHLAPERILWRRSVSLSAARGSKQIVPSVDLLVFALRQAHMPGRRWFTRPNEIDFRLVAAAGAAARTTATLEEILHMAEIFRRIRREAFRNRIVMCRINFRTRR